MGARNMTRQIRIMILRHRKTDLLMAISDDLRGLMVPARSEEDILAKLPAAIQELLEAGGHSAVSVDPVREDPNFPADFIPPAFITNAHMAEATGR